MSTPVSLIMPAYNAAPYIGEAIRSVLAQSHTAWELIIVDDGSTDATARIARSFTDPRIHVYASTGQTGAAAARNLGFAQARHNWLMFLDADDRLRPQALGSLLSAATQKPEAGVIYADYERMTVQGQLTGLRRWLPRPSRPTGDVLPAFLYRNHIVNGGTALIRRAPLEAIGGWNPELRSSNDWALWCLLASITPFHYMRGLTALEYRDVPTGITRQHNTGREKLEPAIDFVFTHPLVRARLGEDELKHIRQRKEGRVHLFFALQQARARHWRAAFDGLWRGLKLDPANSPLALAEFTLALVDGCLARPR